MAVMVFILGVLISGMFKIHVLSFYPPTERFRGYSVEPGIRLSSVRKSINVSVSALQLEYRSEYFDDTSLICRTGHDDVSCT